MARRLAVLVYRMLRYGTTSTSAKRATPGSGNAASRASQILLSLLVSNWFHKSQPLELRGCFRQVRPPPCRADHTRKQVLFQSRGLMDLLQRQLAPKCFCTPVGVTLSWEEAHPGARASRPHKSSRSFSHLLHRNQPAAAPCLCFGRAHAVPAGRAVGCNIAGKLSGNRRDSMRAGRPRSRGCRPRW